MNTTSPNCKQYHQPPALCYIKDLENELFRRRVKDRKRNLQEVAAHLYDAAHQRSLADPGSFESQQDAISQFGSPEEVAERFAETHGRRLPWLYIGVFAALSPLALILLGFILFTLANPLVSMAVFAVIAIVIMKVQSDRYRAKAVRTAFALSGWKEGANIPHESSGAPLATLALEDSPEKDQASGHSQFLTNFSSMATTTSPDMESTRVSSVLSDSTIRSLVEAGRIAIKPWDPTLVQPASVDLRLGNSFRVFHNHRVTAIDLRNPPENLTEEVIVAPDEPFVIHPGEFCLGRTEEWVELPDDIVARIEGKSSLGRLGLIVHATAGFCDPGWKGTLTLELNNLTRVPIKLYPGLLIAQLSFMTLDSPAERPYGSPELGSHYQGQVAATESRYGTPSGE